MDAERQMDDLLSIAQPTSYLDPARLNIAGRQREPEEVVEALKPYLTDRRLERIDEVIAGRTYTVATVVEGVANSGNVAAVMRTAEGLGFLPLHVIMSDKPYKHSRRTAQGSDKWLDVWTWDTPEACAAHLRKEDYRIVVTHLDETAVPISQIDFTRKTALVFGNERDGVSEEMVRLADQHCVIPMTGFAQSFNISVAAAVGLYHAYRDRILHHGAQGDLTPRERALLRAVYCTMSVNSAERLLEKAFGE